MKLLPKYIYHYFEKKKGPFRNISALDYQTAQRILKNINVGFNKNRNSEYLDKRIDLEKILKSDFVGIGGKPKRNDPFYFTLGGCKWLESWYEDTAIIKIPLEYFIDSDIISFTFPDSMISYQIASENQLKEYRNRYSGKTLDRHGLGSLISHIGLPNENKWKNIKTEFYNRYIEVQIWDDAFLNKFNFR